MRRPPDFLVIGVQRGGTTSLYDYITQHPRIAAAKEKEVHYFDLQYTKGDAWYRSRFPWWLPLRRKTITGEASPYYIFHPAVPERVRTSAPDAKLIVLLREPVQRAYSHYHHAVRNGWDPLTFEEAIEAEPERLAGEVEKLSDPTYNSFNFQNLSYVARGLYVDQLLHWYRYFPPERFLILRSEDLYADPRATLHETLRFLGLEPIDLPSYPRRNLGGYGDLAPETRARLTDHYRPHNRRLYDLLGRDFGWPD